MQQELNEEKYTVFLYARLVKELFGTRHRLDDNFKSDVTTKQISIT
jgi:hypothetical protein